MSHDCDCPDCMETDSRWAPYRETQRGPLPEDRVEPVVEQVKCPCKKHRTYKAVRKPTSGCEECWRFYIKVHP